MLIDELHINKAEAKQLLQEQGSVKRHLTLTKQIIVSLKRLKYEKLETRSRHPCYRHVDDGVFYQTGIGHFLW